MAKVQATHSAYQIFEDIIVLAGNFAKLGKTIAAQKIQSSASAASNFVSEKIDLADINGQLSDARESLGQAADYAAHTDVKQMVDDASVFARRHPITTMISVVAVGTLIAHLLRGEDVAVKPAVKRAKSTARKAKPKQTKSIAKPRTKANGAARVNA